MSRSVAPSSLSRRLTRRATIAVLAGTGVAALLAGTGCSAGQIAETAKVRSAVPGANADLGDIALRNLTVLYPDSHVYSAGDDARLVVRIVNTGGTADTLKGVSTDAADSVTIFSLKADAGVSASPSGTPSGTPSGSPSGTPSGSPSAGPSASASVAPAGSTDISVPLPPRQLVQLDPNNKNDQVLIVNGLKHDLRPGESLKVVFTFDKAGSITVNVPVGVPDQVTARPSASGAQPTAE